MNIKDNFYSVYALKDPSSDLVRYIGYTGLSVEKRLYYHLRDVGKTSRRASWIKSILSKNKSPDLEIIESNLGRKEAIKKEIFYIKFFKSIGANLVNSTIGGDGMPYGTHTPEIREKMSAWQRGRKINPEVRAIIIKNLNRKGPINGCQRGIVRSLEFKAKISKSLAGKKQSRETIDKRIASMKNTYNKRVKMGLPGKVGSKWSDEAKAKRVALLKVKPVWNKGLKTGKPSWNSGLKTNKPAWNRGLNMKEFLSKKASS